VTRAESSRERVMAVLAGQRPARIPVGAVTQPATLAQMQAVGAAWPAAHGDAWAMADLASAARTVLQFDLVRVPFDQTVEAELFGCPIRSGGSDRVPAVEGAVLAGDQPLPPVPDPGGGRAGVVAEATRLLRQRFGGKVAVAAGIVGPYTVAGYLLGLRDLLVRSVTRPPAVRPVLDLAADLAAAYGERLIRAGADLIVIEDMGASLDVISPRIYRDLAAPYQKRLVAALKAPVILHICGDNAAILDDIAAVGAAGVSLDAKTDLARAAGALAGRSALVGAIPPTEVLLHGTPEQVRQVAREQIALGVQFLAPGCGLPPATPTENLRAMVAAVSEGAA